MRMCRRDLDGTASVDGKKTIGDGRSGLWVVRRTPYPIPERRFKVDRWKTSKQGQAYAGTEFLFLDEIVRLARNEAMTMSK